MRSSFLAAQQQQQQRPDIKLLVKCFAQIWPEPFQAIVVVIIIYINNLMIIIMIIVIQLNGMAF